jgi:hypothetical protein
MEAVLADTVVGEFKTRLARIGLEYRTPKTPSPQGQRTRG